MAMPGFCGISKMWYLASVTSMLFIVLGSTGAQPNNSVQLLMFRVERGLRSVKGVVIATELNSVSACILFGTSQKYCHAVNYDISRSLCEVISVHGYVLEMRKDAQNMFAALNNTNDHLNTGVGTICAQSSVHWKEQAKRHYTALKNVVYADEATELNYVCKATVGGNEIPGVVDNIKWCKFVYENLAGGSELYRTLITDLNVGFAANWMSYTTGDEVPQEAFVGGHLSQVTPLSVCRTPVNGVQYVGYYNPDTSLAYIHSGSVHYPSTVDLLSFSPNGPTSAGPTLDWTCPRYHVQIASQQYEYIEHHGSDAIPSWAVTANNNIAVGESAGAFSAPAKFSDGYNLFTFAYGSKDGGHTWRLSH